MDISLLGPLIDPVRQHLVPLLDTALAAAAERHQVALGRGADNFSFGTDAWSLPGRLFRDAAADGEIPFTVENHVACILGHEDYRIHHHRVGSTERDDIRTCTPARAEAAAQATERQMGFDFLEADIDEPKTKTVVLAYMANPQDGLCAAYLATVGKVEGGKIAEWDETVAVWSRDGSIDVHSPILTKPAVAPVEERRQPVVRLKTKRTQDANEA